MLKIAVIIGSTRPGRKGEAVGKWVHGHAQKRTDATFDLVDLAEINLPLLDEPVPPSQNKYSKDHTKAWSAKIQPYDGFVFVTPEYNRGTSGALKNAIDFLYNEWTNKAAGFVGYGSAGGSRAIESLRLVMGELQIADVRAAVSLMLRSDWEDFKVFKPQEHQLKALDSMLDQVVAWSGALQPLRVRR
ncbi:MAG: NAD(P)H-dependent oxidoreductase [Deltaproteobacteria bacterium]|nr:NAD(P)H-dependent oxidoreductase [Deltaproteobacteria bacterium]